MERWDIMSHLFSYAPHAQNFEMRLAQVLDSSVEFIQAIGEDLVTAGGKRLRPQLAFVTADLLAVDAEHAMQVALAVELLHSASLLHDDLIDDADTRRGREAAFRRYGNVVSVMSGDFMLAKVLAILAQVNQADFTRLMSHTAAEICEAEVLQFQMAALENYSFENYHKIITGKTAALYVAALEGVAILAEVESAQREALRAYAYAYGRAFQMRDDYLDLLGDEAVIGKPIGGDMREGKATYAVLELILKHKLEPARAILRRHAAYAEDIAQMRALLLEHGADAKAKDAIVTEAERAIAALDIFPESEAKRVLVELAQKEVARVQ